VEEKNTIWAVLQQQHHVQQDPVLVLFDVRLPLEVESLFAFARPPFGFVRRFSLEFMADERAVSRCSPSGLLSFASSASLSPDLSDRRPSPLVDDVLA
jgi:hypothetical protein